MFTPTITLVSLLASAAPTPTVSTATVAAPGQITTYRVAPDSPNNVGTRALQTVLFVPRLATHIVLWPIGKTIYLLERHDVPGTLADVFFNDSRTFGVHPTAFVETGFGLNVGARMVARNMFDRQSSLSARVGYGGRFRQNYVGEFTTGRLISDHFEIQGKARYEDLPNEFFFGLGPTPGDDRIRIQRRRSDASLSFVSPLSERFTVALSGLYSNSRVRNSEEDPNASLDAFRPSVELLYQEFRATYDSRRPDELLPPATPSRGIYLSGTFGTTQVVSGEQSFYYRYSGDARWLIDLGHGTRVLTLRLYTEGVFGDQVPTIDLPRLGGTSLLRGYRRDRFRDRQLVLSSAEYRYPLSGHTAAYMFVDGGRVFQDWTELNAKHWGLGFGGGLQLHGSSTVITRVQVAASRDGDVLFSLVLNPDFDHEPRSER